MVFFGYCWSLFLRLGGRVGSPFPVWSEDRRLYAFGRLGVIPLGSLGLGGEAFLYAGEKRCKEFLSVSWWYLVGRRPARRAGRRQNLSPFRRFLIAYGIRLREGNVLPALGQTALRERGNFLILAGAKKVREGALAHAP